jgi:dienelactone hydrolase
MAKKTCLMFISFLISGLGMVFAQGPAFESLTYLELKADVYKPSRMSGKAPTIFLAHNGFGKKEDWGSFPKELADQGYVAVSIGWEDFSTVADIKKAIMLALTKYDSIIDTKKIAFVAGCHGAVKLLTLHDDKVLKSKITVQTAAALSISEEDQNMLAAVRKSSIPLLLVYSKADQYGYADINNKVAESLREPKKIVAMDAKPHGNELVVDAGTKPAVSKEIVEWLKSNLK